MEENSIIMEASSNSGWTSTASSASTSYLLSERSTTSHVSKGRKKRVPLQMVDSRDTEVSQSRSYRSRATSRMDYSDPTFQMNSTVVSVSPASNPSDEETYKSYERHSDERDQGLAMENGIPTHFMPISPQPVGYSTPTRDAPVPCKTSLPAIVTPEPSAQQPQAPPSTQPLPPNQLLRSQQRLSWRMDPAYSLSDWRLEVFNRSTKTFTAYHVHRVVLAVGPRACGYFQRAFNRPVTNPTHQRLTRLPLIAEACQLVPDLLDFFYDNPNFKLSTKNAVGLAYLAHFLEQSKLLEMAMEFVHQDLGRQTMHQYLLDAEYFGQHELVSWVVNCGANELPTLNVQSPAVTQFLADLPPDYMLQMLDRIGKQPVLPSPNLSTLLVEYCVLHRHEVTPALLNEWTSRLTVFTPKAALAFLELELTLTEPDEGESSSDPLSPLQQRCLDVLSNDWQSLCQIDPDALHRLLQNIMAAPSTNIQHRLMEWFPETLLQAHSQLSENQQALQLSHQREAVLEEDLQRLSTENANSQREAQLLRRTLASTKTELKDQLSGWMRRHSTDQKEHQAAQETWNQEREMWRLERQRWFEEHADLERELFDARQSLTNSRQFAHDTSYETAQSYSGIHQEPCPALNSAILAYMPTAMHEDDSWSCPPAFDKDTSRESGLS